MTEYLRPGGYQPETAFTRARGSDGTGEALKNAFNAAGDLLDQREVQKHIDETGQVIEEAVIEEVQEPQVTLGFPEATSPEARALQSNLARAEALMRQGGRSAVARAKLLVKQHLSDAINQHPHLRDELISASNSVMSTSPELEAAGLISVKDDPSIGQYERVVKKGYETHNIPPHIKPTDPRFVEEYLKREAKLQQQLQFASLMESLEEDRTLTALEKAPTYIESMTSPDGPVQLVINETWGAIGGIIDQFRAVGAGNTPNPSENAAIELAKNDVVNNINNTIAAMRTNFARTFANADPEELTQAQAAVDGRIGQLEAMRTALEANDLDALKILDTRRELENRHIRNRIGGLDQLTRFTEILGSQNYNTLMTSLSGRDVILNEQLTGLGIQAATDLMNELTPNGNVAEVMSRGGQGTIQTDPVRLQQELMTNHKQELSPAIRPREENKQVLRSALNAQNGLATVQEFSSPEHIVPLLNNFTTTLGVWDGNEVRDPKMHKFTWNMLADPNLIEAAKVAAATPQGKAALGALASQAQEYIDAHVAPGGLRARNKNVDGALTKMISTGRGTMVTASDLLKGTEKDGVFSFVVNEQKVQELAGGDMSAAVILRRDAMRAGKRAADEINLLNRALIGMDYIRNPQGEPVSLETGLIENGFEGYLNLGNQ